MTRRTINDPVRLPAESAKQPARCRRSCGRRRARRPRETGHRSCCPSAGAELRNAQAASDFQRLRSASRRRAQPERAEFIELNGFPALGSAVTRDEMVAADGTRLTIRVKAASPNISGEGAIHRILDQDRSANLRQPVYPTAEVARLEATNTGICGVI
jgi:hypothetical protein